MKSFQAEEYDTSQKTIAALNPLSVEHGILRVGGRTSVLKESNPVIIPKDHVGTLLVRHFHEHTQHQGRHFTEGAVSSAVYWIVGSKRIVQSLIRSCVTFIVSTPIDGRLTCRSRHSECTLFLRRNRCLRTVERCYASLSSSTYLQ